MEKTNVRIVIAIYVVLCLLSSRVSAAIETIQRVDIPGLSNNAVLYMHQDQEGNMWLGTYDGLNLYNGRNTVIYRYEPDNTNSINGNIIRKIYDAGPEHIWVTTFMGVNLISLNEKRVIASYTQYPETYHLAADREGRTLMLSLNDFLSYSTPDAKGFIDIHAPGIRAGEIKDMFVGADGQFFLFSSDGKLIRAIPHTEKIPATCSLEEIQIHDANIEIAFSDRGTLHFIDTDSILYSYDTHRKEKKRIRDVTSLLRKHNGLSRIIGWESDVYLSFMNSGLVRIPLDPGEPGEEMIRHTGIFCMYKDTNQDILWMGTDGYGVRKLYKNQSIFHNFNLPFTEKPVRAIYTDEEGSLWLGTKGDGVFRIAAYDKEKNLPHGKLTQFTTDDGLSHNFAFCFLRSPSHPDILWVGTEGPGLSYYSYREKQIHVLSDYVSGGLNYVHSIQEVNDSTLWVATVGRGLARVIFKMGNNHPVIVKTDYFSFERNERVCVDFHSIVMANDSTLLLGSRGGYGLIRFNMNTYAYEFLLSHQSETSAIGDVLCVRQCSANHIYIGASSGMTKLVVEPDEKVVARQFDRRHGMLNDMVHGILDDDAGCMWLSTSQGLVKYNPENDMFHNQSQIEVNVKEFSDDAYWKCPHTRRLFFGGNDGVVWVEPGTEAKKTYSPELRFWDVTMLDRTYYLPRKIEQLVIPPETTLFTLSFIATDYIDGETYEYAYKLEGFNDAWIELQKENKITFSNLPYGKYNLHVKYKNDVYHSHTAEYILPLVISPPWYQSMVAKLVYVLALLLILTLVIWQLLHNWQNKQLLLTQRLKEEQKESLYNAKLNFFTNITHELCTPLTLINGVTEHLQQYEGENEGNYRKYISLLQDNVKNLNDLIQEILDFRKIQESGIGQPHLKWHDLAVCLHSQLGSFIAIAEKDGIDFQISADERLPWYTDLSFFKKILVNLVSNAFKYVDKRGTVKVSLGVVNHILELRVYNSGAGFEPSVIPTLFDRYRILDHMNENKYMQMTAQHGLGLSICDSLARSLQGQIEIESQPDAFVEVIIAFPELTTDEAPVAESKIPLAAETKSKIVGTTEPDKPLVLVIDDNKDIVWFVADTLSREYEVRKAYNATDALEIVHNHTPALIITDILMPDIDGLEFIRQIKSNKFTRHIPVIIISARITDEERAEGLNLGADAYLTKPFSALVLHSTVNRLISRRKEMKEYFHSPESAFTYTDGQLLHQEDKEFLNNVLRIVRENIDKEALRPELIAEKMGLNSRNLYRRFKKISSLSPSDFIKDYRFTYAAQLLVTTNLSIQEIIYKVGINNKSYFYREFFKKYQMKPKEYRKGADAEPTGEVS